MSANDLEQRVAQLEARLERYELIFGALGEVLKAGTTSAKEGWKSPPTSAHFPLDELEKILYTLGEGLVASASGGGIECPPWCPIAPEGPKTSDDTSGGDEGGSKDESAE